MHCISQCHASLHSTHIQPERRLQLRRATAERACDDGRPENGPWTGDIWATNFSTFQNFGREFGCWYYNAMCSVQCTLAAACNSTKFYCSNKFILMSVLLSFDSPTHKYKLPTDELWTLCSCSCNVQCNFWLILLTRWHCFNMRFDDFMLLKHSLVLA